MITFFAYISLLVLFGLIVFQVALILGAPIGRFAWGGSHDRLPKKLRIASTISIALYLLFAAFISTKAGIAEFIQSEQVLTIGMWVFTVYFFIGIIMNAISRSKPERNLMTPVAVILAITFLVVALS